MEDSALSRFLLCLALSLSTVKRPCHRIKDTHTTKQKTLKNVWFDQDFNKLLLCWWIIWGHRCSLYSKGLIAFPCSFCSDIWNPTCLYKVYINPYIFTGQFSLLNLSPIPHPEPLIQEQSEEVLVAINILFVCMTLMSITWFNHSYCTGKKCIPYKWSVFCFCFVLFVVENVLDNNHQFCDEADLIQVECLSPRVPSFVQQLQQHINKIV